jgi:hypothetical protein
MKKSRVSSEQGKVEPMLAEKTRGRTEKTTKREEQAFVEQVRQERFTTASWSSMSAPRKSPIKTLSDIEREGGPTGSKTGTKL